MTVTSYNGWPANIDPKAIGIVPLTVAGIGFPGGVKSGDVHTVLEYIATQFHNRVEHLIAPGCWGWSYRQNRNAANLSCHSSGTAIDCNAPKHPNGVEAAKTFTDAQIKAVRAILAEITELAEVVHWGGDWHAPSLTPDPMHFEIHNHDLAKLARVATAIKSKEVGPVSNHWTRTRARLLAAVNHPDALEIAASRVAIRAFLATIRRALTARSGLPKE